MGGVQDGPVSRKETSLEGVTVGKRLRNTALLDDRAKYRYSVTTCFRLRFDRTQRVKLHKSAKIVK